MKKLISIFEMYAIAKFKLEFAIFILLCTLTSVSYAQIIPTISSGPLKLGQSVVTSYEIAGGSYNVVRVVDTRNRPPFIIGGSEFSSNQFAGVNWTNAKLGNVFGIALDDKLNPNIFVSRSTMFCPDDYILRPDSAIIYRLDGANWGASIYVRGRNIPGPPQANVNWIPNTGPGLGNLCFDKWHQQIFVTNHEDGRIYRVGDNAGVGNVLSWFDPFNVNEDTTAGFAPKGDRLWGIGSYGTSANNVRVYFSRWRFDRQTHNTPFDYNEIWSIALDANGEFIPISLKREIELPLYADSLVDHYSNPVSDIELSFEGDILCGERTMAGNMGPCVGSPGGWAHRSRILEYTRDVTGAYTIPYIWHKVGQTNAPQGVPYKTNSSGGVDFQYGITDSVSNANTDCDSIIIGTGDYLFHNNSFWIYGLQQIKRSSAGILNVEDFSNYMDINGINDLYDKTKQGDVDVYRKDLCSDTSCITLVNDTTYCDSAGMYIYQFQVHNNSPTRTIEQLEITVDSPLPPNYVVTVPSTINVNIPPLGTSGVQTVNLVGPGAVATAEVCYTLSVHFVHDDCPWCCYIENCIKLPECGSCAEVLVDSLYCSNNEYFYSFTLQNGTIYDVTKIQLTSPGGTPITFVPQIIHFSTPILPGQVFPAQVVEILGGTAGITIPIRIKLFSEDFECCYFELPQTFPGCDSIMTVIPNSNLTADHFELEQNYPNPFNPATFINFSVPEQSIVEINIYDVSGRLIQNLVNNVTYTRGVYSINFDGSNLPSGMYYYRLKANDYIETRRMILLK